MNIYHAFRAKLSSGKSIFIMGAAALCICTSATVAGSVDFSGEWKLNESKSDLGQFGGRGAAKSIKVTSADPNGITIERTSTNQNGENVTRKESLTFDGKEAESTGGFGNSKRKATAKWSEDGKAMLIDAVTTFDRNGQSMEIKTKETWKLGDNDNTLIVDVNSSSSFGENTMKLVYEKVK